MNSKVYKTTTFLIFFLLSCKQAFPTFSMHNDYQVNEVEKVADLDDSFDFDNMTEQMIEVGLDKEIIVKPPSTIMVWIRKIGMPIAVRLAYIYQACSNIWGKFFSNDFAQK